jgi:hypothetical protein
MDGTFDGIAVDRHRAVVQLTGECLPAGPRVADGSCDTAATDVTGTFESDPTWRRIGNLALTHLHSRRARSAGHLGRGR